MIGILIDAARHELRQVNYSSTDEFRDLIGGWLELGYYWRNGEVLYVDEEGLLKPQKHFFRFSLRENPQPLAGNGLVVGRELHDDDGEYIGIADATITISELWPLIRFMSREQFDAWAKANASEPAVVFTEVRRDGTGERTVLDHWGRLAGYSKPGDC